MVKRTDSFGRLATKGLVLFVIITAGIFAGFWISVKSGLTETLAGGGEDYQSNVPETNVHEGDLFPEFSAADDSGSMVSVAAHLKGKTTIVGFVSDGCEPCLRFAGAVSQWEAVKSGAVEVVLLTESPDMFREQSKFTVFESHFKIHEALAINVFPTIFVVDPDGVVQQVAVGFGRGFTEVSALEAPIS